MPRRAASTLDPSQQLGETGQLNLFWLINLRWAAALGQVLTVLFVSITLTIELPLTWLFAVMGVEVASNLGLERWFRRRRAAGWQGAESAATRLVVATMLADTGLLAALLYLTGGVANPFATFFFVHVVLAAVLLRPRWAYTVVALACGFLWLLIHWHWPLPDSVQGTVQWNGMFAALSLTTVIGAYFVSRVTRALELRVRELAHEREHQARADRLEALGTLAAGAAHELASPLSTIAVVAKELQRRLEREGAADDDLADARLVRDEVARCRRILDRMTLESGNSASEELVQLTVAELLDEMLSEVSARDRIELTIEQSAAGLSFLLPPTALAIALRAVISNALDASGAGQLVHLRARCEGDVLEFLIEDQGVGMDADHVRRALDPFFTTKEPGEGMGLGLFLTRSVVDRLGGELALNSTPGRGTRARIRLPLANLRAGS